MNPSPPPHTTRAKVLGCAWLVGLGILVVQLHRLNRQPRPVLLLYCASLAAAGMCVLLAVFKPVAWFPSGPALTPQWRHELATGLLYLAAICLLAASFYPPPAWLQVSLVAPLVLRPLVWGFMWVDKQSNDQS